MLRFCHGFHGRDVRLRLGALLLVLVVEGCAATATSDGAAPKPSLPLGELLLVGFGGTQVEGNEEVRALVCDVKVGGLILFERDARTGEARNITAPGQVRPLTADLQAGAGCAGRLLLIAADNEGGLVMDSPRESAISDAASAGARGGGDPPPPVRSRRMGATPVSRHQRNLAPVVDVAVNPVNPAVVTLGRTFVRSQQVWHARAFIQEHARRGRPDFPQALPGTRVS